MKKLIRQLVITDRRPRTPRFWCAVNCLRRAPRRNIPAADRRSHYRCIGSCLGGDEISCVVLNRVNEYIQLVNLAKRALICCLVACGIDAIGKKHYRFASVDLVQTCFDDEIDCVVKACREPRDRISLDSFRDNVLIVRRLGLEHDQPVERHD